MTAPDHDPGDLEQYAGEVIPDPWSDPRQTDWPDEEVTDADVHRGASPAGPGE